MHVRCLRQVNERGIAYSLTVGKLYPVLAVEFYDRPNSMFAQAIGDYCLYRIRGDEGIILPLPSNLFEVVSGKLPSNWSLYRQSADSYTVLPGSWARPSFWEDFYNDDQATIEEVRQVENELGSQT